MGAVGGGFTFQRNPSTGTESIRQNLLSHEHARLIGNTKAPVGHTSRSDHRFPNHPWSCCDRTNTSGRRATTTSRTCSKLVQGPAGASVPDDPPERDDARLQGLTIGLTAEEQARIASTVRDEPDRRDMVGGLLWMEVPAPAPHRPFR